MIDLSEEIWQAPSFEATDGAEMMDIKMDPEKSELLTKEAKQLHQVRNAFVSDSWVSNIVV